MSGPGVDVIAAAIADPGSVTPRLRDDAHQYLETVPRWSARAVLQVLTEHGADERQRLVEAARHPHKGPNDTDASMLREAASRIAGGYVAGGSNTQRVAAEVLRTVAAMIQARPLDPMPFGEATCPDHKPVQHRDGKPPWCRTCGLTADYEQPLSRLDRAAASTLSAIKGCRSGCPTQDHATWGDCARAASIAIDRTSLRP